MPHGACCSLVTRRWFERGALFSPSCSLEIRVRCLGGHGSQYSPVAQEHNFLGLRVRFHSPLGKTPSTRLTSLFDSLDVGHHRSLVEAATIH